MKIKLGYIARFGKDGAKVRASRNPEYISWGEVFKIHAKYIMIYFFWMKLP